MLARKGGKRSQPESHRQQDCELFFAAHTAVNLSLPENFYFPADAGSAFLRYSAVPAL
jgi:hypothetical protein